MNTNSLMQPLTKPCMLYPMESQFFDDFPKAHTKIGQNEKEAISNAY